jgi:hypothetical protein
MKTSLRAFLGLAALIALTVTSASAIGLSSAGIKLGLNLASLSADDSGMDLKSKMGFAAGGFVAFNLSSEFDLQAEILFSQKGATWDFNEQDVVASYDFNFTYIEIPILLKANIPLQSAVVRPVLYAGPFLSFKAGAKTKYEITAYGESQSGEEDMIGVKSTDFGGIIGAGVEIKAGKGKIGLEARYGISLSNMSTEGDTTKHRVFTFLLGYSFF